MIHVYKTNNTDYDYNGDMTLTPTVAYTHSKLNREWTASLTHPIDLDGRWKYLEEDAVVKMPSFNGDQLYRIRKIRKADSGITCTMEPIFYDTLDSGFLIDVRPTEATGQEALDKILQKKPYSIYLGESNITTKATAYYQYKNTMEAINGDIEQSFINRWGGEIEFDNFVIRINKKIGSDKGVEIRYGKNVTYDGLTEEVDTRDVVTRIYPKAYNGYTMTDNGYVDSENINKFPVKRIRTLTFDDVKMAEDATEDDEANGVIICSTQEELDAALTQKCQEYYETGADKPKVTLTADMVIIQNTELYGGYSFLETVSLGDVVHCRHDKLDITTDSRVIELKYDSIRKKVSKVVIGDFKKDWFEMLGYLVSGNFKATSKSTSGTGTNTGTNTGTTYTWEKYEAVNGSGYTISYDTEQTSFSLALMSSMTIYQTISVDQETGEAVLSVPLDEAGSGASAIASNYESYPYYYGDKSDGSTDNTAYKITSYSKVGTTGYAGRSNKVIVEEMDSTYTRGDYIENVTSNISNTYPENGYQDGYWYVKK